jgi:DNA polymerase-1
MSKWKNRNTHKDISAAVISEKSTESLQKAHKFIESLFEYRKMKKLYDTYAIGVETALENNAENKVYVDYKVDGTVTGRLSCSQYQRKDEKGDSVKMGVSFHTLPRIDDDGDNDIDVKGIRGCFISPPGYAFITADQKAEELRVLAHIADERNMINAFHSGEDLHKYTASLIYKKPISEITKKERQVAKTVSFLIVYGGGAFNLANTVGIPIKEAEHIVNRYHKVFPGVSDYMDKVNKFTMENKYVETIFGRRRNLLNVDSKDKSIVYRALRQALNFTIPSPSTDIILLSGVGINADIQKLSLDARLAAFVHDSIEGICKFGHLESYLTILYEHMINNPTMKDRFNIDFKVNFEIDVEVGFSFGDGVAVKYRDGKPINMDKIMEYLNGTKNKSIG